MTIIYAISDIHGFLDEMTDTLDLINLNPKKKNLLIFLGDYVNRGTKSCQVLYKIRELEEKYSKNIVVLIGNHDQMFLEWWEEDIYQWLEQDEKLKTTRSFFKDEQWKCMLKKLSSIKDSKKKMNELLKSEINNNHGELLKWLISKKKDLYYETANQIFVHAGICEIDEELWKHATEENEFTWKYPGEIGPFYKDIIAGHISSVDVSKDEKYLGKVYWDEQSHFFIDGDTNKSGIIPVLKYNTDTRIYSSYEKNSDGEWIEYQLTKSKAK